ncbi:hypothetical protein CCMSSC00406_0005497 [Pleurotus cornucopiae]|uniref:Uncharacterized protein n=1 Tax=Pleurotus cornucopiae TaxID=5321 RepID=A0ACB7IU50_PLECO|nr:hypothetical protein CCMSSC00406_0005497 [Pleurotus cornucopiae]
MLNHLLLIACICIVIALILYLFYWNRLLAGIIGLVLRILYWNQGGASIWVEIGSIHFSLITGRILLKDVNYHSSNQTIKIVKGQIEWRYWIRKPMLEQDIATGLGMEDHKHNHRSQYCRVQMKFQGFQWYIYNRTASYDSIVEQLMQDMPRRTPSYGTEARRSMSKGSVIPSFKAPPVVRRLVNWFNRQLPNLDPKDLLPLGIDVTKGIIIIGNKSTPNLLLAEFEHTGGIFGVVQSRSKHDLYKQVLDLKFQGALVRYMENDDYVGSMVDSGTSLHERTKQYSKYDGDPHWYASYHTFSKLLRQVRLGKSLPTPNKKHEDDNHASRSKGKKSSDHPPVLDPNAEYAIERRILEAPVLELSYYADVVGEVPPLSERVEPVSVESIDIGNGGLSPQWGIDIIVRNGFIRYGPWADRQRAELQRAFFPSPYHDVLPSRPLHPGDQRVWTNMRIFIELVEETTLHIPFREPSKNLQWDGLGDMYERRRAREPASLHLVVGDRSSINYTLPMVVGPDGYNPLLEVHLDTVEISSSLNDIRLVTAESCRIHGEMPAPLKWDSERKWSFGVTLRQSVLYLLRDHINMITDLVRDWTSGPPHDYHRFVPMIYQLKFELHHFALNMYANDHNIIDKPLIRDENALLTLKGTHWNTEVIVPSNKFRPDTTCIPIISEAPNVSINLSLPKWNTNALDAPKEGNNIGHVGLFQLDASYRYYAEVQEGHVEQLQLDLKVREFAFKSLGWAIRYFMVLRENYLGSFTHFSTLGEYLDRRRRGIPAGDPIEAKYRPGQSNPLQVELMITAEDSIMVIPSGLPGYERSGSLESQGMGIGACAVLVMPQLQLQLRVTEFYMEMSLNIDTVACHVKPDFPELVTRKAFKRPTRDPLLIDGLHIVANRLFGPQPRTTTYLCIWEVRVGQVKGILSAWEGETLAVAGRSFGLNYVDAANAPAAEYMPPLDPDITILKFTLSSLDLTWLASPAALVVSLPKGLQIDSNDKPGLFHKRVTSIRLPIVTANLLHATPSLRKAWLETASFSTDLNLDIYAAPYGWQAKARAQNEFVAKQDSLTGRAARMLAQYQRTACLHRDGIYLPQPRLSTVSAPPIPKHPGVASHAPMRPMSGPRRWSQLSHLSESEGEEGISEADRDARLAKTRTATPVVLPPLEDEDPNMSSGDESDDEDLTADSSDSDWSDDTYSGAESRGPLKTYAPFVRHYGSRFLDFPDLWNGSPFFLLRDSSFVPELSPSAPGTRKQTPEHDEEGQFRSCDTTTFRFECHKGIKIHLTPVVLQTLTSLAHQLEAKPPSPELNIDTIVADRMGSIPRVMRREQNTVVDGWISTIRINLLQHATLLHDESTMMSLDFTCAGCHISGFGTSDRPTLNLSTRSLGFSVAPAVRKKRSAGGNDSGISLKCIGLSVGFSDNQVDALWDYFKTEITHNGPEYILSTVKALQNTTKVAPSIFSRRSNHRSLMTQKMVHDIIQFSAGKPMVDSLSTTQPSYLVQSGVASELRNDITIRFLYHLRSCLNLISSNERQGFLSLRGSTQSLSMRDTLSILEARLKDLALDVDHSMFPHFMTLEETLFPNRKRRYAPIPKYGVTAASINAKDTTCLILDHNGQSASEVSITSMSVVADFRYCAFAPTAKPDSQGSPVGDEMMRKISILTSVEDISVVVMPHLLVFAQHTLRVQSYHAKPPSPTINSRSTSNAQSTTEPTTSIYLSLVLSLNNVKVQAAAQNLIFELALRGYEITATALSDAERQSANISVKFQDTILAARSPSVSSQGHDQDRLASFSFNRGSISFLLNLDPKSTSSLAVAFVVGGLILRVPRSALRLYRFVEEWRADFFPGIEGMAQDLLREIKTTANNPKPAPSVRKPFNYRINGKVPSTKVALQVMHGMWLSWEVQDSFAHFKSSSITKRSHIAFGIQLPSQVFTISSNSTDLLNTLTRVQVVIPQITLAGNHDGTSIQVLALVEEFRAKVKPSHWDTLLAVQQKFGQDFNEFLALVQKTQSRRTSARPSSFPALPMKYVVDLKMKGFRVGLEGISSTLYLECSDIYGGLTNVDGLAWKVGLSDLALSLAPRAALDPRHTTLSRNHRSAFVIVDVAISALSSHDAETIKPSEVLKVEVSKIHAVMQPSSIGEVGDFIDHLQAEMLERREQRQLEVAAFKERTRQLLQTFEAPIKETSASSPPWFSKFNLDISMRDIGVAFPLTLDQELEMPQSGRSSNTFKAFLLSIESVRFGAQRGETGQAVMKNFSFQFVSRFRQSVAADFSGDNHQTRNRLLYPEMTAHIRSETSLSSRKLWVSATVDGFILDLESSIPEYVFSLIDVYRQGKDRVAQLSANLPHPSSTPEPASPDVDTGLQTQYTTLPTSNVSGSLTFLSGTIRIHSGSLATFPRSRSFTHPNVELPDEAETAEIVRLPVVSLWAEYRATPASHKLSSATDFQPSILIFKSTIHSSQNTLKPTLLPFIADLTNHVETRMRKVSALAPRPDLTTQPSLSNAIRSNERITDPVSSMQISFSLRIDQSKLELTCQPDVNVIAGLHWESGGFMISISPGARQVTFNGCVSGLTVGLKHGFLSEDCVKLDAHNLAFSVTFSKMEADQGTPMNSISIVLDTEFSGGIHFSRLQDVLCFKAVWLDRIPILKSESVAATKAPPKQVGSTQDFTTAVLLRVRHIVLDVDLGHSISAITLDLTDSCLRTKFTESHHEVAISVSNFALVAKGNISGTASVPRCVFQTIRRRMKPGTHNAENNRMLELRMTSGSLVASLESEHQRLLHYRAEPLDIEISDDWSMVLAGPQAQDRPLLLSFTVNSAEIIAATTVGAIPKLISYANKFRANLQAQQDGASRESKTFRTTRTPKPDNALSAVANAMLSSARERFKEETGLSYIIKQHMSLRLGFLRLVVFPRTMRDLELASFVAYDVHARLDRLVEAETIPATKNLLLSFSSMTISRFTQLTTSASIDASQLDCKQWLDALLKGANEATIVGLPSMTMHMISEEKFPEDPSSTVRKVITYDFDSKFVRRTGVKDMEDIFITLNVGLYSWLTLLRKNFTREMDQVQAASDWRTMTPMNSPPVISGRRKGPDSLPLLDSPRSATSPRSTQPPLMSAARRLTDADGQRAATLDMFPTSPQTAGGSMTPGAIPFPQSAGAAPSADVPSSAPPLKLSSSLVYQARTRSIQRLTMRQLGEATPDVMHPFFMKKAGFNLEDALPQYVNEYATAPLEEIMEVLLKVYSRQLLVEHPS